MPMNAVYRGPADCPATIPLFPLPGALLLPRGQMPLNIFEKRYVSMIDDALRTERLIGMIQPEPETTRSAVPGIYKVGCAGRITQFAESGDGRYLISLTGVARFRIEEELSVLTPYRQARISFTAYPLDFEPRAGEDDVDRAGVIAVLRDFVAMNRIDVDWSGIDQAPNEALVNALSMMAPFGVREKQALLEAPDLKTRADTLIAIAQIEMARRDDGADAPLQ
ncbi:MAG: peptidase S16 [Beijerinckiaceae bacterium]|nr:peptidase S16 [Beijerinckiaceae bacterium]